MSYRQKQESKKRRKERPYNISKRGIKDDIIDKQILAIHCAMAEKILKQPQLKHQVFVTLEQRLEDGRLRHGEFITWCSILELIKVKEAPVPKDQADDFRRFLLENTQTMRKLRRKTPLTGILTETERSDALSQDALGEIKDVNNLF